MNDWVSILFNSDYGPTFVGGTTTIIFIMFLSFAIGHFIGYVYMWTHEAISYSRTFVASIAVLPVIIAVMMVVMAGNLLIAFGLLAVFGVIRFRNVLKDTRDTTFILWTVMEGLTVGTMRFSTALLGALGVGAVFLYLRLTSFGTRHRYDAVVTLRVSGDQLANGRNLRQVMGFHAKNAELINERRANDGGVDMAYRVLLRDPGRVDELQAALVQTEGLANVSVFMHADEAEI
ncbi:MAG: DUF4956 domain-containing protein [Thermoguttaceae bacterium]|jgi:hypothetical protein